MTKQWKDLFALAREIAEATAAGATVDPEKARRLARTVLELRPDARVDFDVQPRR